MFYPFSQFREIDVSLPSLQTQPTTAPNLFQRGVEYGKYVIIIIMIIIIMVIIMIMITMMIIILILIILVIINQLILLFMRNMMTLQTMKTII